MEYAPSSLDESDLATVENLLAFSQPTPTSPSTCPLYPDVIRVILRYLDNRELITCIQLSRQWDHSLRTASSSSHRITTYASGRNLTRIQENSAMAMRVARAVNIEEAIRLSQTTFENPSMTLSSHLSTLLPNLTTLNVMSDAVPQVLPPRLESLSVEVSTEKNDAKWQSVLPQIQHLSQLKHLQLKIPSQQLGTVDCSSIIPPQQLKSLELFSVNLSTSPPRHVSHSLVRFIRSTRLASLALTLFYSSGPVKGICLNLLQPSSSSSASSAAVEPNNKFPLMETLTSIHLEAATLDCALLQTLTSYPALTSLSLKCMNLGHADMQLFEHLPNLRELKLVNSDKARAPIGDSIVIACKYLSNLRVLHVQGSEQFTTAKLDECLSQLPNLTDLSVEGGGGTNSFAPLIQYGLPKRLTKLTLRHFYAPHSDFSDFILPLELLESLELSVVKWPALPSVLVEQIRKMPKLINCDLNL